MGDLKIPQGYRLTEVGVIPEDWDVKYLKEVTLEMLQGINTAIDIPEYVSGGIPMLKANNVIDQVLKLNDADSVSSRTYLKYSDRYKIKNGDFLFSNIGARLGTGSLFQYDFPCTFAWNVMRIVPNKNIITPSYLSFLINSPKQSEKIKSEQSGSGMGFIPKSIMQNIAVGFPPNKKEQTAIANALSDVDALISSLEKLIKKKQAIKTASMQQLLTGKTRLPQFAKYPDGKIKGTKQSELGEVPEDWEVVEFGQLFERQISRSSIRTDSVVAFVGMQDVSENAKLIEPKYISYESVKSGFTYFERRDVLVAKITPCFENGKGCFTENLKTEIGFGSTEFHVLRANKLSDSKYIYYITVTGRFRSELESEMVGSAGHRRVPITAIQNYRIACSVNVEEQAAIATILSDMDTEIQTLEQRLNKTRQIKQGMMQELLTGRTRLI